MKPNHEDSPKFFKVYKPDICFETLRIPNAFIRRVKRDLPKMVILRGPTGKLNVVGVNNVGNDVFFSQNWKKFVKKNSVKTDDFLVFQYNGDDVFDFVILDKSGYMNLEEEAEKEEEEEDEEAEEEEVEEMDISREEGPWEGQEKEEGEDGDEDDDDDDEEEEEEMDDESDDEEDGDEDDDDGDEEDDVDEDDEEEEANLFRKKRSLERNGDSSKLHPGLKIGSEFSKTDDSETDALELETSVHIRNPYFFTEPRSWMKKLLNVPLKWLGEQNLALEGTITFLGPLDKESPGNVVRWQDGRIWITGWGDFCEENNLKEHEKCICEFMPERGRWGKIIRVQVV